VAEEEVAAGRIPAFDDTYFLVDPLDGTKEFIRGGDDYTVNIGLIERAVPRLGVVFAPATRRMHGGIVGEGAWIDEGQGRSSVATRARGDITTAVASKSHLNQATIDYLEAAVGNCGYVSIGSSLKFCIVAEGKADIYARAAPTSEWDTAAGHAVLLAAGGLVDGPGGDPLRYGKPTFVNRAFVATSGWKPPRLEPFLKPFSGGGELPHGV
jgi:3'(2'), 5'-bisphosphate nucleotidase